MGDSSPWTAMNCVLSAPMPAGGENDAGGALRAWFGRLSLRYKLTLAALGVEALMLALLIINGVHLTSEELQKQAENRAHDMGKTLVAALLAPLSQQDDASVRDIVVFLLCVGGLKMIVVCDSNRRIVHQAGTESTDADFRLTLPIEYAGQRYGEIALVLSGDFIQHARNRYLRQSLFIAAAALLLTGILLALSVGGVIRRFDALTRASKRMALGDLDVKLTDTSKDENRQQNDTNKHKAETKRFNVDRARENEARFHAIAA